MCRLFTELESPTQGHLVDNVGGDVAKISKYEVVKEIMIRSCRGTGLVGGREGVLRRCWKGRYCVEGGKDVRGGKGCEREEEVLKGREGRAKGK